MVNSFRYKNFRLSLGFEGKSGYDINLYEDNISVAEPIPYGERIQTYGLWRQITEVNHEGVPTEEVIENYNSYITETDYFILKHIGLEYQIRGYKRSNTYAIGLQYNKMRRMYLYVNDTDRYQEQFQKPSFYSSLSLSLKMKF